jgi:hypothetical protein
MTLHTYPQAESCPGLLIEQSEKMFSRSGVGCCACSSGLLGGICTSNTFIGTRGLLFYFDRQCLKYTAYQSGFRTGKGTIGGKSILSILSQIADGVCGSCAFQVLLHM